VLVVITVRAGTVDDHHAVASLRYRMDTEDNSPSGSPADFAATFDQWLDRHGDGWGFFVAEDDEHLIGMLWLAKVPPYASAQQSVPAPDRIRHRILRRRAVPKTPAWVGRSSRR
jgi:hypothetical protein